MTIGQGTNLPELPYSFLPIEHGDFTYIWQHTVSLGPSGLAKSSLDYCGGLKGPCYFGL